MGLRERLRSWLLEEVPPLPTTGATASETSPDSVLRQAAEREGRRERTPAALGPMDQDDYSRHNPASSEERARRAMDEAGMTRATADSAFTPGGPMSPFTPPGSSPKAYQFIQNQNMIGTPRSYGSVTGMSFASLITLAYHTPKLQDAIDIRINQVAGRDWHIETKDPADAKAQRFRRQKLEQWTQYMGDPGTGEDFTTWLKRHLHGTFSLDSAPVYFQRLRNKKLGAAYNISGPTITRLIDQFGRPPRGDCPAYVQWMWGRVENWIPAKDMIYPLMWPTPGAIYGYPRLEYLVPLATLQVRNINYLQSYYTKGQMPELLLELAEEDSADWEQVAKVQRLLDNRTKGAQAMGTLTAVRHGTKATHMNKAPWDNALLEYIDRHILAAMHVTPAESGDTTDVNRASGKSQKDVEFRQSIFPTRNYVTTTLDRIYNELGYPDMKIVFDDVLEEDDAYTRAKTNEIYLRNGILSLDKWAAQIGEAVDPAKPRGRIFLFEGNGYAVNIDTSLDFEGPPPKGEAPAPADPAQDPTANTLQGADEATKTPDKPLEKGALPTADKQQGGGAEKGGKGGKASVTAKAKDKVQQEAARDELIAWRRYEIQYVGTTHKPFGVVELPDTVHKPLRQRLTQCSTKAQVKDLFDEVIGDLDAPYQ